MTEIEKIEREIDIKRATLTEMQMEIAELETRRTELLVQELRAKMAEKAA